MYEPERASDLDVDETTPALFVIHMLLNSTAKVGSVVCTSVALVVLVNFQPASENASSESRLINRPSVAAQTSHAGEPGFVVPVPLTIIAGFGTGEVWRTSRRKDKHGACLPPWTRVAIDAYVIGPRRPEVGSSVTVFPLVGWVGPTTLRIRDVQFQPNPFNDGDVRGEDEKLPDGWVLKLEAVTDRAFYEAGPDANRREEVPFGVVVLYPAQPSERLLAPGSIPESTLPAHVSSETIRAAIDITGDGLPDLLIVETCGEDWSVAGGDGCDNTTGFWYERVEDTWRIIDLNGC